MKLYLLRHATAADVASSDAERELTRGGREEARIAGQVLRLFGVRLSRVLSSPLVRARQTAEVAVQAMKYGGEIELVDELLNGGSTTDMLGLLKPHAGESGILLVGHMPSISEHLAALIGVQDPGAVSLGKGSIACVELESLRPGVGQVRWMLRQKQLRLIAESQ